MSALPLHARNLAFSALQALKDPCFVPTPFTCGDEIEVVLAEIYESAEI